MAEARNIQSDVFKLCLATFIVSLSMSSWSILLPVYLQLLGGSYLDVGLLGTASGIPYIILPLIVGILCDKFGRRLFFYLGLLMTVVNAFLLLLAGTVHEVIIIRAISAIAYAFFLPSSTAMVSDLSEIVERVRALGYLNFAWAIGMFIGPFLGGVIVEEYNFKVLFLSSMAIGSVSFLPVLFGWRDADNKIYKRSATEIPIHIRKWNALLPAFLIVFVFSIVLSMIFNIFPAHLNNLGLSPSNIGVLFAVFGLARAFTFIQAGRMTRLGEENSIIVGILCISIATWAIYTSISFSYFIVIMLILGFGIGILIPLSKAIASKSVDRGSLGSAIGATESIFGVGWTMSPFIGGLMAQSIFGPSSPYLMLSLLSLMTLTPIILLMRSKR